MTEHTGDNAQLEHAAELRRSSDAFMQRLDRLHELELRKRELPPDEPEFIRLAREIEDMARALLFSGGQQVELAEEVHREAKANDIAIDQSIRETPPLRDAVTVLADWRAAERRLSGAAVGSDEETAAQAEVERLRDEYRRIMSAIPREPDA